MTDLCVLPFAFNYLKMALLRHPTNMLPDLESSLVGQALGEVNLHVGDGNTIMGALGARAAWNHCTEVQLHNLPHTTHTRKDC